MTEDSVGGPSAEDMKTPEQREKELATVNFLVRYNLGKPRAGEEAENVALAERYSADLLSRLTDLGAEIPQIPQLNQSDMLVVLCAVGDTNRSDDMEVLRGSIAENLAARGVTAGAGKIDQLAKIALVYGRVSARVEEGWTTAGEKEAKVEAGREDMSGMILEHREILAGSFPASVNDILERPINFEGFRHAVGNILEVELPSWQACTQEEKNAVVSVLELIVHQNINLEIRKSRKGPEIRVKKE